MAGAAEQPIALQCHIASHRKLIPVPSLNCSNVNTRSVITTTGNGSGNFPPRRSTCSEGRYSGVLYTLPASLCKPFYAVFNFESALINNNMVHILTAFKSSSSIPLPNSLGE